MNRWHTAVKECDPPGRLVQTWRVLTDPHIVVEGCTRLRYVIHARPGELSRLMVTHGFNGAGTVTANWRELQ